MLCVGFFLERTLFAGHAKVREDIQLPGIPPPKSVYFLEHDGQVVEVDAIANGGF